MKRFIRLLLLFTALLLLPFGIFAAAVHTKENPYRNSFTASLVDKYERLTSVSGARLIFIGGSSLPFGLKSAQLEAAFGLPVVDLGVYAALGTRVMAEIALPALHEGDIVILAPELDPQTYSDYFNPDTLWEAACENTALLKGLSLSEKEEMACRWFKFALEKKQLEGESVPDGILYARSSFDQYGDIAFPREANIMAGGYDASQPISLSGLRNDEFFAFVRSFIEKAEKKGARVYFGFSPVNEAAVRFTEEEAAALLAYLQAQLPGRVLGSPADTTYPAEYFYNTNYHLTDAGAARHTAVWIRLLSESGILTVRPSDPQPAETTQAETEAGTLPVPDGTSSEAPEMAPSGSEAETTAVPETTPAETEPQTEPATEPLPYDPNERYCVITRIGGFLYVTGLTEEGARQEVLTLPESYEGEAILGIGEDALSSDHLTELTIPGCYRIFASYIFEFCPQLKRIHLLLTDPSSSSIPMDGLFDGCAAELTVSVPADRYAAYLSDYDWRRYKSYLTPED